MRVSWYPPYTALADIRKGSPTIFALLETKGLWLEEDPWDGDLRSLPMDRPGLVLLGAGMDCRFPPVVDWCHRLGHLPVAGDQVLKADREVYGAEWAGTVIDAWLERQAGRLEWPRELVVTFLRSYPHDREGMRQAGHLCRQLNLLFHLETELAASGSNTWGAEVDDASRRLETDWTTLQAVRRRVWALRAACTGPRYPSLRWLEEETTKQREVVAIVARMRPRYQQVIGAVVERLVTAGYPDAPVLPWRQPFAARVDGPPGVEVVTEDISTDQSGEGRRLVRTGFRLHCPKCGQPAVTEIEVSEPYREGERPDWDAIKRAAKCLLSACARCSYSGEL